MCAAMASVSCDKVNPPNKIGAVVIGMENSKAFGNCLGSKYDSDRMKSLFSKWTDNVTLLQDSAATVSAVKSALNKITDSDLMIVYYSGHGGNYKFPDTKDEEDGMDEFLCLWDNYLRDNEIWNIITKCRGRVWLIFDCCHSRTMFKMLYFTQASAVHALDTATAPVNMMCWSGCNDDQYSYGSSAGGELTNAFFKYYKEGITYSDLWSKIQKDTHLKRTQTVYMTIIGSGFEKKKVME